MRAIREAREVKLNSQLWEQFEQAAQEQRRKPLHLLQQVLPESLAIYQDEKLFRQLQREARRSGYQEEDAVTGTPGTAWQRLLSVRQDLRKPLNITESHVKLSKMPRPLLIT